MESLLERMTIRQPNGAPGLLAKGQFGDAVNIELGKLGLEKAVRKVIDSGDQVRFSARKLPQYHLHTIQKKYRSSSLRCSEIIGSPLVFSSC